MSLEGIKFPKSLVVVAGLDLIQDWQLDYAEGLKRNGQDVKLLYLEQATIGFCLLPNNEHFYTVMDEMRNFVNPELSINGIPAPVHIILSLDKLQDQYMNLKIRLKEKDEVIECVVALKACLLCFTAASALECWNGVFSFDVLIDRETSLLIQVYWLAETEGLPSIVELEKALSSDTVLVIIFFHGGSFVHSSSDSAIYGTLCRRLVGICKAVVVSVNYRRAPENRYPCAYDDGWAAVKWVSSKPWPQSRKDSKVHIYLAGDSSGGNIVHNVAVRSIESGIEVMGNMLLNPLFSGQKRTELEKQLDGKYFVKIQERDWYWRAFLPEGEDRDHPACNPFGPNGISLEGIKFPKSLVVVAGLDLIQDWQMDYAEGLKRNGQDVKLLYLEQATIGFYLLPNNEHFIFLLTGGNGRDH
ncbi:Gibberellin receptor GID1C [Camellia lanceoleosa]|uniref:Gibberellin receptor GID1C n=1 Tax=Camellia lanceoleosa TaxID=1840588 RepID=A0ACC0IQD6_9ERIC|nr:Gibberellin receptor GID1C [Camellia lanceoleosa]